MYIQVEKKNLFDVLNNRDIDTIRDIKGKIVAAHCVASDFGMGGGIARQFVDKMDMRKKAIQAAYKQGNITHSNPYQRDYGEAFDSLVGKALKVENVYNLVTKTWTYEKPVYDDLLLSLESLKEQMQDNSDSLVVIPKLGCGIDGLSWKVVKALITSVFYDTNVIFILADLEVDQRKLDEDEHYNPGMLEATQSEYDQFMDAWEKVFEQPFMGSDWL